jgi:AAA+ superfamily predicted ATPase
METATERYVKDLVLNVRTNHPITVVYTDDPNETIGLTRDSMKAIRNTTDKILYWSSRVGWSDISDAGKSFAQLLANPVKVVPPTDDLKKTPLAFTFASPEALKARFPVFIVSLLSVQFKKDVMAIMQELRDFDYMVRNNQNNTYRLIIVANKSFEIPPDYENIFGIVNHSLPTKQELRALYNQDFLSEYIDGILKDIYSGDYKALRSQFEAEEDYAVNTLTGLTERQVKLILFKGLSKNHIKSTDGKKIISVDVAGFKDFLYDAKFAEISKSGVLNLMQPIPMDQVGGLENLKNWLSERSKAFTPEALARGIKRPKGMVLVGPSGTGKSWVAKATSGVLKFPCIQVNLSSIFSKWVGESESNIEQMKATIESMAPAVVFMDEIDKVFASEARGSAGDSGVTARVLGKLLTWIQDTEADLFFVVTANRVQNIPSELMRKGRFDEIWCVTFPTEKERKEIINIHLKKIGVTLKNIDAAIAATEDYSAAELEHIVAEANMQSFVRNEALTAKHLVEQAKNTNPISIAFKEDISFMKQWAEKHARKASVTEEYGVGTEKGI